MHRSIFSSHHLIVYFFLLKSTGVKPANKDFTPDDAIYFKKMTENKSFPAVIKNVHSSDPYEMQEVYEIVLFGKNEKVHDLLIKEGRALPN